MFGFDCLAAMHSCSGLSINDFSLSQQNDRVLLSFQLLSPLSNATCFFMALPLPSGDRDQFIYKKMYGNRSCEHCHRRLVPSIAIFALSFVLFLVFSIQMLSFSIQLSSRIDFFRSLCSCGVSTLTHASIRSYQSSFASAAMPGWPKLTPF